MGVQFYNLYKGKSVQAPSIVTEKNQLTPENKQFLQELGFIVKS